MKIADDTFLGNSECEWVNDGYPVVIVQGARRLSRTKSATPITVKGRLASRLGLSKPPPGRSIPMIKTPTEKGATGGGKGGGGRKGGKSGVSRTELGLGSLQVMAGRDDLNPVVSDER